MKTFPTKNISFDLIDSQTETLERLKRRTEHSEKLTSQVTDKSFRGTITNNQFELISSTPGIGAFCSLSGTVEEKGGTIIVEVNMAFRRLIAILYILPFAGLMAQNFTSEDEFDPIVLLVLILQILLIRFFFVELAFRILSPLSLNRLRDVLDVRMR